MIAVHRAFTYVFVILVFACGGTSSTPPTPSATAIAAPSSPTPTRPPRAIFPSVTTSAGVIWEPTDEPPGPPVEGVRWWAKGTWPDGNTTIAAVYAPPGDGPFPAVVYLHEAAGLTQAQLDVARKISAGGFIVVAGCRFELARVPCKRRLNLYETSAAFVDFAKAFLDWDEWSKSPGRAFGHILPDALANWTAGRREVRRLTGSSVVPVLVTDDGEVIQDSAEIERWAQAHPAAAAPAPA